MSHDDTIAEAISSLNKLIQSQTICSCTQVLKLASNEYAKILELDASSEKMSPLSAKDSDLMEGSFPDIDLNKEKLLKEKEAEQKANATKLLQQHMQQQQQQQQQKQQQQQQQQDKGGGTIISQNVATTAIGAVGVSSPPQKSSSTSSLKVDTTRQSESSSIEMPKTLSDVNKQKQLPQNHIPLPCYQGDQWNSVEKLLVKPITSIENFEQICSSFHDYEFEFSLLRLYLKKKKNYDYFFYVLSMIQASVLEMPKLFKSHPFIPILLSPSSSSGGMISTVSFTREQIRCLLAAAFFGFLPDPNEYINEKEYFSSFMESSSSENDSGRDKTKKKQRTMRPFHQLGLTFLFLLRQRPSYDSFAKIDCLLHYFDKSGTSKDFSPKEVVKFHRRRLECLTGSSNSNNQTISENKSTFSNWSKSKKPIKSFKVYDIESFKGIEDIPGCLHADFANQYIGGGVLHQGSVQEEILFMIKPECLLSLEFTPVLDILECVLIEGAQRFSQHKGYGDTFEWESDYISNPFTVASESENVNIKQQDTNNNNYYYNNLNNNSINSGNEVNQILVFDASMGGGDLLPEVFHRDLFKVYCGVLPWGKSVEFLPFATGNWGCGAFGGTKEVKFLIQLLAISEAGRDLIYHTFKDSEFTEILKKVNKILQQQKLTVGDLYQFIMDYSAKYKEKYMKLMNFGDRDESFFAMMKKVQGLPQQILERLIEALLSNKSSNTTK